jgi:hypothetical protein
MELKRKLMAAFILTRPYSLPGIFLLYYMAKVIITGNLMLSVYSILESIPVLAAWISFTLLLEAEHKHSNREKIPYSYPVITFVITVLSAIIFNGLIPIVPLIFFLIFVFAYIKKNSIPLLGNFSFVSRGFVEAVLFFFSLALFSNSYLHLQYIALAFAVLLITSARNLIGDIRDTKFDEITFTVRFGDNVGYVVSILLYVIGGYALFTISQGTWGVVFPIIIMVLILAVIDNGHMLHRLSVILSSVVMAAYILYLTGNGALLFLLNVVFLCICCNFVFYDMVPRRSNPPNAPTAFGLAPWSGVQRPNTDHTKRAPHEH